MPSLLKAYDQTLASNPLKAKLSAQVKVLRGWDYRWSATSVPTSLAVYWGEELGRRVAEDARKVGMSADNYMANRATAEQRLQALAAASDKLAADFGSWKTPWGDINRFQRLTGDIVQPFNDAGPSIPVGFTSSRWGSLASFGARTYKGTKKMYGTTGNSFVAVVEFGDTRAGEGRDGRRRERRSQVAALQRSSRALQHGRSEGRVLLPSAARGAHRAAIHRPGLPGEASDDAATDDGGGWYRLR